MHYKTPESVLVIIHTPALQVLLLERAGHPGFWQSVTGSMEKGETPIETACRELEEETGIRAHPRNLLDWRLSNRFEILPQWRERYAPGVTHNLEHVLSLCLPSPIEARLAPAEHCAQCWLDWREAASRCFSWSNRDAILMLAQRRPQRPHSDPPHP